MIKESYVQKMAEIELVQAKAKHEEVFHSEHEAESILREEMEETSEAVEEMVVTYANLWAAIRENDSDRQTALIEEMKKRSFLVVAEAVQVYAMCIKWEKSFIDEKLIRATMTEYAPIEELADYVMKREAEEDE